MKFDSRLITIYAAVAAAIIVALILAQMYWKRRLTKWAESQHLQLVSFRCWIMFGTFWGFTWGEPITQVEWSDADDYPHEPMPKGFHIQ